MKGRLYINGIGSISSQPEDAPFSIEVAQYFQNIIPAISPAYKEHIPAMALRRMSKGIKMGLTAARIALKDAGVEFPAAIITGTGEGSKQDTEKFLQQIIEQQEELLTPTSFIQSTHNTIGGQIALHLKCRGYNMTYSQGAASLETALLDALLYNDLYQPENILVGGVDEISPIITSFQYLDGQLKQEAISNLSLLGSNTPGTITSEGAHFFCLSQEKKTSSYAELVDITSFYADEPAKVSEEIMRFLKKNKLPAEDLSMVLLGNNGDSRYDGFYHFLQDGIFEDVPQAAFKHLCGEYNTATGFAMKLACQIFRGSTVPDVLMLNGKLTGEPASILIYNQYLGENHSLILMSAT